MESKQIQELIKAINKSNISELNIEEGDFKITIKQTQATAETQFVAVQAPAMPMQMPQVAAPQQAAIPQAQQPAAASAPAPAAEAANDNLVTIKSPMIGTFYRSPSPDKPSFVNVGDDIK